MLRKSIGQRSAVAAAQLIVQRVGLIPIGHLFSLQNMERELLQRFYINYRNCGKQFTPADESADKFSNYRLDV